MQKTQLENLGTLMVKGDAQVVTIDEPFDEMIQKLSENRSAEVTGNKGPSHALSVLRAQIKSATSTWIIFSGELDNSVYADPVLVQLASDFLTLRGGSIKVLVALGPASPEAKLVSDGKFASTLSRASMSTKGRFEIRFVPNENLEKFKTIQHFQVADSQMIRLETDEIQKTALVCFNSESTSLALVELFERCFAVGVQIERVNDAVSTPSC
jgi:hypothetical protein